MDHATAQVDPAVGPFPTATGEEFRQRKRSLTLIEQLQAANKWALHRTSILNQALLSLNHTANRPRSLDDERRSPKDTANQSKLKLSASFAYPIPLPKPRADVVGEMLPTPAAQSRPGAIASDIY